MRTRGVRRYRRPDDEELGEAVRRAQAGDDTAFGRAYTLVQPMLLRYIRGFAGNDAEDLASEVWYEITRDIGRFSGDGSAFRGWAATIARSRVVDAARRRRARPRTTVLDGDLLGIPARHDTAQEAMDALATRQVLDMIAALPPHQAEAVLLRVVAGLDGSTVARMLGKQPSAVRMASYRGLKRLARALPPADISRGLQPGSLPAGIARDASGSRSSDGDRPL
ncbi:RNA polymerase sigma factor [Streptomyces sp. 4N124]|uniref:RNA polymerase sigma factor n=1 Tax=Streptomyces sp. 4N124 TaxID=3457420 RepID=UPI003FD1B9F6